MLTTAVRTVLLIPACLFCVLLIAGGCGNRPQAQAPPSGQPAAEPIEPAKPAVTKSLSDLSANEILQKLLATYRQAKSYEDQGVVRLMFSQGGQPVADEWPVAVALQRPNKLALTAYQATVKCDGTELKARIDDPLTANVDGQVVVRPAPRELKLSDLAGDALLYDILSSRLRRQPIQLELLLESSGLVSAFGADVACQRLPDERHDGQSCFRVEVPSPGGPFVFWIDQANYLLRRLDYPAAALVPDLVGDSSVSQVQLLADLRGATLDAAIPPDRFAMPVPADARRMKTFVIPPRPLPSSLFGKQPDEFYFTTLDGGRLSASDLDGKITILVWYHDHPACEATLEQVALAHARLKDDPEVAFYAVATDPTAVSNESLQQRLRDWQAPLPLVRDLEAFGDKAFKIELQPTLIVLDRGGRVQIFQTGGNPQLADQLAVIVERLKRGDDLAVEVLAQHEREQVQYEELVARGGPEPGEVVELAEAVIRRRSEPKHIQLRPLWTCNDLKTPGNILLVEQTGREAKIFVFEGWRTITEVSPAGQIVARNELELPPVAAVTFARTALTNDGKRYFVAAAPLSPQLFVFDDAWKLLLAFPAQDQAPLQLADLALVDIDDSPGAPELVTANVGDIGLVALALSGEVRWRNRAFANAVSLAVSPPDDIGSWAIYVTGETGSILRINRFGRDEPPLSVGNWPILRLVAARFPSPSQAALLGLATSDKGQLFAVGLTDKLMECWNYPLPIGAHQRPIEPVTSSHVLPGRQGEWWLAGPDGSIHLITEDGSLFDSFFYGTALTGLAATSLGGRPVLLVATDDGLAAWEISLSAPPSIPNRPPEKTRER